MINVDVTSSRPRRAVIRAVPATARARARSVVHYARAIALEDSLTRVAGPGLCDPVGEQVAGVAGLRALRGDCEAGELGAGRGCGGDVGRGAGDEGCGSGGDEGGGEEGEEDGGVHFRSWKIEEEECGGVEIEDGACNPTLLLNVDARSLYTYRRSCQYSVVVPQMDHRPPSDRKYQS
jgi:hypothetical protein